MQTDTVNAATLARLSTCNDLFAAKPPFWHWLHFLLAAPPAELGADGHPLSDPLLPHDPALPSRMWAGGRLRLLRQPAPGASVQRESRVLQSRESEGRSGRLRFLTLHHAIHDAAGLLVDEEQDLVFRAPALRAAAPRPAPPAPAGAITHSLVPDEVLLFRFSALTFNAHRIHYDRDYARRVEHYPELVVHGPLQASLLAALLGRAQPGALRRFDFRGQAPAFAGRALMLEAWPDASQPGHWHLQTRDPDGAICMTAQAEVETPSASRQKGP